MLLRVVPVNLYGPSGEVTTSALLDEGSTVTLIDASLAAVLGATGPEDPMVLRWTNATQQMNPHSQEVNLQISGAHSDTRYDLCNVRTTSDLCLPFQDVDSKHAAAKWKHLEGIDLS